MSARWCRARREAATSQTQFHVDEAAVRPSDCPLAPMVLDCWLIELGGVTRDDRRYHGRCVSVATAGDSGELRSCRRCAARARIARAKPARCVAAMPLVAAIIAESLFAAVRARVDHSAAPSDAVAAPSTPGHDSIARASAAKRGQTKHAGSKERSAPHLTGQAAVARGRHTTLGGGTNSSATRGRPYVYCAQRTR